MKARHGHRGDLRNDTSRRQATRISRSGRNDNARYIVSFVCVALMIVCAAYMIVWEARKIRISRDNESYRMLYEQGAADPIPTAMQTDLPDAAPTEASNGQETALPMNTATEALNSPSTAVPTDAVAEAKDKPATAVPTDAPTKALNSPSTAVPTDTVAEAEDDPATAVPTDAVTEPPLTATAASIDAVAIDATRAPRATADADTLVYALATAPPVQQSFSALLALNPETVGYLRVGEDISLPVVQRKNDNEYYLNHSFEGEESIAGTLFLDGANLLVPEDDNLIIYGHNMRNGSMFHALSLFETADYMRQHPIVHFDTLYENRVYVPFAAFTASMEPDNERYLDIRQFLLDEGAFDLFVERIQELSSVTTEIDVRSGDRLLLLVTCEYLHDNGRFVVALRQMRLDETEAQMRSLLGSARDR